MARRRLLSSAVAPVAAPPAWRPLPSSGSVRQQQQRAGGRCVAPVVARHARMHWLYRVGVSSGVSSELRDLVNLLEVLHVEAEEGARRVTLRRAVLACRGLELLPDRRGPAQEDADLAVPRHWVVVVRQRPHFVFGRRAQDH